jgi:hypothetical protein
MRSRSSVRDRHSGVRATREKTESDGIEAFQTVLMMVTSGCMRVVTFLQLPSSMPTALIQINDGSSLAALDRSSTSPCNGPS